MNFLVFTLSLLATTSVASDKNSHITLHVDNNEHKNVCSLLTLVMKRYPEKIPFFLVTCKDWGKELAMAFAVGLAMGKHPEIAGKHNFYRDKATTKLAVNTNELKKVVSENDNWKWDTLSYNPFDKLINLESFFESAYFYSENMELVGHRGLLAEHAQSAETMIAVDVAILQWFAHQIQANANNVIEVDHYTLLPICALSLYPLISKFLMDDIQIVVDHARHWTSAGYYSTRSDEGQLSPFVSEINFSALLTLIKLLDEDSPIRLKLETIAAKMYTADVKTCAESRLILGPNHPLVLSMEKSTPKEKLDLCNSQMQLQFKCGRKVHSFCGDDSIFIFDPHGDFLTKNKLSYLLRAKIEKDNLEWEMKKPMVARLIYFKNKPGKDPAQNRLFIISKLRPPAAFCEIVLSFKSILEFRVLLGVSKMRQMILTYGITILESSSSYGVNETNGW